MRISEDELQARVRRLPALPKAALELRTAVAEDDVGVDRVVSIVGADPALTAAALRLANSSFYGVRGRVATLRDAVRILGLNTLVAAVTTAAVMSAFPASSCPGFDLSGSWRHALATGLCAEALARSRGLDSDLAYFTGLLHDIGQLALAVGFPDAFALTLARQAGADELPVEVERELLGIDHAHVGALLAGHWYLPPTIVSAIAQHHHQPSLEARPLPDLLHVSDAVAYALGAAGSDAEIVPPISPEVWDRVGLAPEELNTLFAQIEARVEAFASAAALA